MASVIKLAVSCAMLSIQTASANDFLGDWTGSVREVGIDVPYSLTLKIFEVQGRVFQNSKYGQPLDCDSGGVSMEKSNAGLKFSEMIVRNRDICSDGTVRVYPNGDDMLIWEWFYPDGTFGARADLTRTE